MVCLGLPRSGSTWVYNVARELLAWRYPEGPIACGFSDDFAGLSSKRLPVRCLVLKAHNPQGDFRALLSSARVHLIISIRDPRDAVASMMQSFSLPFHEAASAVYMSAKAIANAASYGHHLLLRYEDGFPDDLVTVQRMNAAFGCGADASVVRRIHEALSKARVADKLRELGRQGTFRTAPALSAWDPETHWHPGHLGDGRVGKYPDVLTTAQIRRLEQHFAFFMSQFFYGGAEG